MAVTLKRKRGAVSYREPSSDEGFSDSDSELSLTKKQRAAPGRRSTRCRSRQGEPSSGRLRRRDASPIKRAATAGRRASGRRKKRNVSYRDESSDDDVDEDFEDGPVEPQTRRTTTTLPSRPKNSQEPTRRHERQSGVKRRPLGAPLKPRATPHAASTSGSVQIPTDGRKPDWASLPYHVLLQVFVYASHPLHDENMLPTPSIGWLVQVARICSAFAKPALTALYRNPPIYAIKQNRRQLVSHLVSSPPGAHVDYQVMVKRLELDATQMASSTDPLHTATDLAALIKALTTVREIDILDPLDRAPYRERLRRIRRWNYPDELFDALRQSELRLRSWRWHRSFCPQGPLWIKNVHTGGAFQSLRELIFTKFHPDETRKADDENSEPTAEELLASALAVLPNLQSLTFESCRVVNERLLPLLPNMLISLNITNCINITSDSLQAFLTGHGQNLEELILNHNQSLDLSYLVDLKRSCPRLEVLRMDLNYYSSLVMSADNEPLWDALLEDDQIPTWPSTLRVVDMEYLRKWSSGAATNFFASLTDAAGELLQLREIRILAMVDIDWRQRADFRRKWAARYEEVFASRSPAPSPQLASLRAYREWKAPYSTVTNKNDSLLDIAEEAKNDDIAESDSDAPLLTSHIYKGDELWNSQRLRRRGKASANYDETSSDEEVSDVVSDNIEESNFIQGRCHTVNFRIDNLRPREELYDEGDFLDEERSGDEDWTGNDVVDDDYAW